MHVLTCDRAGLIRDSNLEVSAAAANVFERLLARRLDGEPIAYVTGTREFWSLEFGVSNAVLIPRPETELLVEWAVARIDEINDEKPHVADLGTGSGAIAVAIALERPQVRVTATDASLEALAIARINAERLGARNIDLRAGNWCAALDEQPQHLIVSNPPYIATNDAHLRHGDVRFEPQAALVAGADGMDHLSEIITTAPSVLIEGGGLVVEHGFEQAAEVREIFKANGYDEVATGRDIGGCERVTAGRRRSS